MELSVFEAVKTMKNTPEKHREFTLNGLMRGEAESAAELAWRADLCTSLRVAGCYPPEKK